MGDRTRSLEPRGVEARMLLADVRERMFGRRAITRLGRFELRRLLGRGAHGSVYLADDTELQRQVAVKVLATNRTSADARARLIREAQALARVKHPNVLTIHDVGVEGDRVFIAMEHVEAGTLKQWCREHPPGTRKRFHEVVDLAIGVAQGLAAAHEAEVVHRDIKPANILVGIDGRPRLGDFGVARPSMNETTTEEDPPSPEPRPWSESLTRTGALVGTPAYMAPEQLVGESDEGSDQWSLCATFWEASYGQRPFEGKDIAELIEASRKPPRAPPAERTEVPRWWRELLARGLHPEPSERWPSVAALVAELQAHRGARARTKTRLALGFAGLGVVAAVAMGYRELDRRARLAECDRSAEEIATTWPERAEAVQAGMRATGLPLAEPSAERLFPMLDSWAASWRDARREACVHHSIDETFDDAQEARARACLELQRVRVDTVLDPLEASNSKMIADAMPYLARTEEPATCLDPVRLARTAWPDDSRWSRVLDIRRRAIEVQDLNHAGDMHALETARALLEEAEVLGFEPLIAESRLTLGLILARLKKDEAEALLRHTYFDAIALDLPTLAAEGALALEWALVHKLGRQRDALEWALHAEMWIERLGESEGLLGAQLADYRGMSHAAIGEFAEALEQNERGLRLREANLGPSHPDVAISLYNIARALAQKGETSAALQRLERALQISQDVFGEQHPRVWSMWEAIAIVRGLEGDLDEAVRINEQVLRWTEAAYGPDDVRIEPVLNNLGATYSKSGRHAEAITIHERSLKVSAAIHGPEHPDAVQAIHNLAATYSAAERHQDALPLAERAVEVSEVAYGSEHPSFAQALINLGTILRDLGRLDAAEPPLLRGLAILEGVYDAQSRQVTNAHRELTELHAMQEKRRPAADPGAAEAGPDEPLEIP